MALLQPKRNDEIDASVFQELPSCEFSLSGSSHSKAARQGPAAAAPGDVKDAQPVQLHVAATAGPSLPACSIQGKEATAGLPQLPGIRGQHMSVADVQLLQADGQVDFNDF